MARQLLCAICKQPLSAFDGVPYKKGYAHPACFEAKKNASSSQDAEKTLVTDAREQFDRYLADLFNVDSLPQRVITQTDAFLKKGYSFNVMRRCLDWFYRIENNPLPDNEEEITIGIIPYVRGQAEAFWRDMAEAQRYNRGVVLDTTVQTVRVKQKPSRHIGESPYDLASMMPEGGD